MKLNVSKVIVLAIAMCLLAAGMVFAAAANAQTYMQYGVKALQAKQYDNAIKYLAYSAKMQPDTQTYYYLGYAYMGKGDKANALANFQQSLKLNPSNAAAKQMVAKLGGGASAGGAAAGGQAQQYLVKGHQYLKARRYDAAIKFYAASAKLQPTYQAYQFMGTAYYYKGDKANAKTAYEKSLQLNPNNPGVRNMLSKLGGGTGGGEQRLGEQLGVHPLLLAGLFAGAIAVLFLF
jgi:tetratricopeptide (TPR) repeat protein